MSLGKEGEIEKVLWGSRNENIRSLQAPPALWASPSTEGDLSGEKITPTLFNKEGEIEDMSFLRRQESIK